MVRYTVILHCFDAVGWVTERVSGLLKVQPQQFPKVYFLEVAQKKLLEHVYQESRQYMAKACAYLRQQCCKYWWLRRRTDHWEGTIFCTPENQFQTVSASFNDYENQQCLHSFMPAKCKQMRTHIDDFRRGRMKGTRSLSLKWLPKNCRICDILTPWLQFYPFSVYFNTNVRQILQKLKVTTRNTPIKLNELSNCLDGSNTTCGLG